MPTPPKRLTFAEEMELLKKQKAQAASLAREAAAQRAPTAGTDQRGPFIPVTDWNQRHPWPPIGGLRHLIFHATSNGFDKVIRRVGRRVLIDEAAFFAWVDGNGGAK